MIRVPHEVIYEGAITSMWMIWGVSEEFAMMVGWFQGSVGCAHNRYLGNFMIYVICRCSVIDHTKVGVMEENFRGRIKDYLTQPQYIERSFDGEFTENVAFITIDGLEVP